MTFADAVAEISRASGRDITFRQIPLEDYRRMMTAIDVPADYQALVSYLFTTVLDGRNATVCNGVAEALGRPARDFSDYAELTAQAGGWSAVAA